jgi:hypothetical protein
VPRPRGFDTDEARALFVATLDGFLAVAETLDDNALLAASRCHGWTTGAVVAHVHLGLQEMLLGLVDPTDASPTVDAAGYWAAPAPATDAGAEDVDQIRFVQRLAAAYRRPSGVVAHLRMTADGVRRAALAAPDRALRFQGHVLRLGNFLATWVLELTVHQLDLARELDVAAPGPEALALTRTTIEALAEGELPAAWPDELAVLIGTGRVELDEQRRQEAGDLAERLPCLT